MTLPHEASRESFRYSRIKGVDDDHPDTSRPADEAAVAESRSIGDHISKHGGWFLAGFAVLFFGALASRGFTALTTPGGPGPAVLFGREFWTSVALFGVGGGIVVGTLIVVWRVATRDPFGRALLLLAYAMLVFALTVWPTPFWYYRTGDGTQIVRVNRITGDVAPTSVPRPAPSN
jgi:hypothetical protein